MKSFEHEARDQVRPHPARTMSRVRRVRAGLLALACTLASLASTSAEAGVLRGRVRYQGTPPPPSTLYMTLDPACDRLSPKGRPSQSLLVSSSGGIANAIVHVKSGLPAKTRWAAPAEAARIDQKGCVYEPHVLAVRVGQEVEIRNSDPTYHDVTGRSSSNPPFSAAMPDQHITVTRSFAHPEVAVKLKCAAHPWMSAFVGVFDHPFFAVSGADGSFVLPELPEGDYTVEAWHETLGVRSLEVSLEDDEPAVVEFSFAGN